MSSGVKDEKRRADEVEKVIGESVVKPGKEADTPKKVTPIPRPQPPFPQILVKKREDGKYRCFIPILKQFSINIPLI